MRIHQREGGGIVIESYLIPFCRLVAGFAVLSILSIMLILCGMAGIAIFLRILIIPIDMTGLAGNRCVRAGQGESCCAVVIEHVAPLRCLVTRTAICPKLAVVIILCRMTGITILRGVLVVAIHMA